MDAMTVRRFEIPDLHRHGGWLIDRLLKAYPHLNDRQLQGWLRGIIYDSESLFLYQQHSVGLAQIVKSYTLAFAPVVEERFVWAQDRENAAHVAEAAAFYDEIARWAKNKGIDTAIVEENSDVSHETIQKRFGRVFQRTSQFVKIK